jgi:hypothetical protein
LKDIVIVGEKILKWIDPAENSGGCCESGNDPWSSIKYRKCFEKLRNC